MTFHHDKPGIISKVTTLLAAEGINVSTMRVFRSGKYENAVMIVGTDGVVPEDTVAEMKNIDGINTVITILPL